MTQATLAFRGHVPDQRSNEVHQWDDGNKKPDSAGEKSPRGHVFDSVMAYGLRQRRGSSAPHNPRATLFVLASTAVRARRLEAGDFIGTLVGKRAH